MLSRANECSRVWKNYNSFYRKPGTVDEMNCEVCGSICDVKRSEVGPTGFASAMAKKNTEHDYFSCPHNDEKWHWEALAMCQELRDTYSPSLKKIIQDDIADSLYKNLGL